MALEFIEIWNDCMNITAQQMIVKAFYFIALTTIFAYLLKEANISMLLAFISMFGQYLIVKDQQTAFKEKKINK